MMLPHRFWDVLGWIDLAFAFGFTLVVLASRRRTPGTTVAWILTFYFLPYLGFALYLTVGYRNFRRRRRRRVRLAQLRASRSNPSLDTMESWRALRAVDCDKVARLAENLTNMPVFPLNRLVPYEDAFSIYGAIGDAIVQAKHHVHLEYYIFDADERGEFFRDLLIEKAKSGVECRLLVDHLGSFALRRSFVRPMERAGVRVGYFSPLRFNRLWRAHLRNHRKLVITDGKVGFIGSQNIGGEKIFSRGRRLGWRDTQVRIEGPAVHQLQTVFAEDWAVTTTELLTGDSYFPEPTPMGESWVQTVPTGPDESELALEMILTNLLPIAESRITVTTPYFVPSNALVMALESAARRGVQVELLVPKDSDHFLVHWASRSWFRELVRSGIRVVEYPDSFVHAKLVTIDEKVVLLGSANMDMRSFRLNFECSLLVYDTHFVRSILRSFDEMRARSVPWVGGDFSGENARREPFWQRVRDGLCRLLSPLL